MQRNRVPARRFEAACSCGKSRPHPHRQRPLPHRRLDSCQPLHRGGWRRAAREHRRCRNHLHFGEGSRPEDFGGACSTSVYDLTMHLNPPAAAKADVKISAVSDLLGSVLGVGT